MLKIEIVIILLVSVSIALRMTYLAKIESLESTQIVKHAF